MTDDIQHPVQRVVVKLRPEAAVVPHRAASVREWARRPGERSFRRQVKSVSPARSPRRVRTFEVARITLAALLPCLVACGTSAPPPEAKPADSGSAFALAGTVTRPSGSAQPFRVVPLQAMSGDVEILYGDPEKAGEPFAMRIRELPGTIIPLHSHPVDEHITILEGTWYFAVGETWDRAALRELRQGDYAFAAKGTTMYGYSPDGAVVQVQGIGPFHIHWRHGAKTLDDADAVKTFTFTRKDRVHAERGPGTIRNGYASGDVIQYEIAGDDGKVFMANQAELRRIPK